MGSDWDFSDNVIIGHSSGAVAILGLLEALPYNVNINTAVLVGAFTKRLSESPSWEMLRELFKEPLDFKAIKQKSKQFIFVHSKDDPYCPIDQAEFLAKQTGYQKNAESIFIKRRAFTAEPLESGCYNEQNGRYLYFRR